MKPWKFPDGMLEYVRQVAPGRTAAQITEMVNRKFGQGTVTITQIRVYKKNNGIVSGIDCRFRKGMVPYNKGRKMTPEEYEKAKKTFFQKGNIPHNHRDVGTLKTNRDGYVIEKVQEEGSQWERFQFRHRLVWEKHHGKIPDGMMVIFLDGNKENCNIENLRLISRSENAIVNKLGLRCEDPEVTEAGIRIAQLMNAVRDRENNGKKQE